MFTPMRRTAGGGLICQVPHMAGQFRGGGLIQIATTAMSLGEDARIPRRRHWRLRRTRRTGRGPQAGAAAGTEAAGPLRRCAPLAPPNPPSTSLPSKSSNNTSLKLVKFFLDQPFRTSFSFHPIHYPISFPPKFFSYQNNFFYLEFLLPPFLFLYDFFVLHFFVVILSSRPFPEEGMGKTGPLGGAGGGEYFAPAGVALLQSANQIHTR